LGSIIGHKVYTEVRTFPEMLERFFVVTLSF